VPLAHEPANITSPDEPFSTDGTAFGLWPYQQCPLVAVDIFLKSQLSHQIESIVVVLPPQTST